MDQPRVDIVKHVLYSYSLDASFFLLLQKDFYIAHEHNGAFCLFLYQKDLYIFHELFLKAFLLFFDNSYLSFIYIYIYIYTYIYIKVFLTIFLHSLKITLLYEYFLYFSLEFSPSEFSSS